jgi:hypothetical protein
MGSPCEPLTERQELIAELEALGYDTMPGVQRDWSDWRDRFSDDTLQRIIANIKNSQEQAASVTAADDAGELPDISELVEAIRETVAAGDGYNAAHPEAKPTEDSPAGKRWREAFAHLRTLLSDCDKAMEAFAK